MNSRIIIRAGDKQELFDAAKDATQRADRGEPINRTIKSPRPQETEES